MPDNVVTSRLISANHTSQVWATISTVPKLGEICLETDTKKIKVGNGTDTYANLPTPVAPCGVQGISYSTGGSSGTYYYLGTNGSGISNIGSMSTTAHCICFSYIAA